MLGAVHISDEKRAQSMKWSIILGAATTAALWGAVYSALEVSLAAFSPGEIAFLRFFVASTALSVHARIVNMAMPPREYWPRISAIGIIGFAIYPMLLNTGQYYVDGGTASLIINATPAIAALTAVLWLREPMSVQNSVGIVISFCGVALIVITTHKEELRPTSSGVLLLAAAACAHALHFVLQKGPLRTLSPLQVTVCSMLVGTVCLLPWAPSAVVTMTTAPMKCLIAVVYLGLFPSAVAYLTWAFVLARLPASTATNILSLIPLIAVTVGWVFLDELPTLFTAVGGAVIFVGVILVQGKSSIAFVRTKNWHASP
jgi:drug/metabolite transporter (DMT)-like permease